MSSKAEVPLPRAIDRDRLKYVRPYSPVKVDVPSPRSVDASKVSYLKAEGQEPKQIEVPVPASLDRDDPDSAPKPRKLEREAVRAAGPEPSVLEKNVHSPVTPGAMNFPPFSVTPELEKKADQRIAQYPDDQRRSAVLPLLHEVQHRFGFISPESIEWVAGKLDIAPIKVVEVVTFYPGFRQKAPGKLHFRVCRTLSCAMGGSYELMAKICEITGVDRAGADAHKDPISVSPCGNFSVEYAECLASCGTAPVCLVNDDFHEGITADKAQDLINQYNG